MKAVQAQPRVHLIDTVRHGIEANKVDDDAQRVLDIDAAVVRLGRIGQDLAEKAQGNLVLQTLPGQVAEKGRVFL